MNVSQTTNQILETISVLKARLDSISVERTDDEIEVFSEKSISLYQYMLGNSYLILYQRNILNASDRVEVGLECLKFLEASVSTSSNCMDIVDSQRLLSIHTLCKATCLINSKFKKAKMIADITFESASLHTNLIDEQAINMLQRLRDDFMSYLADDVSQSGVSVEDEDEDAIAALLRDKRHRTKKTVTEVIRPREGAATNRGAELVRRMRRIVSLPVPVQLETIPSAAQLLKALDRIFRAYVRGNALPGQMTGGNTVDLDGKSLSFRTFILHGPYMSWRGFQSFLTDFSIARPPLPHTRSGKNYLSAMSSGRKIDGGVLAQAGPDPPLELKEAGVLFIEASHTATPALVLSKYLRLYAEIAEDLDYEPWSVVTEWANDRSANEWYITAGINFMQFVDCLGKIGAVAYSSPRFADMLPTSGDKMEHFLSAYLGLSDERRWKVKVDSKLKRIKNTIAELKERIREGGDGGGGKRKGDSAVSPNKETSTQTKTVG